MSYTQAQRWKQAKTKTPAHHLTAIVKPARLQRGRRGRATPRKRWNDAVGTALAHGPGNKNEPPSHMAAIHRFSTPNGLRRVTRRPSTVGVMRRPSTVGPSQAMAEPADGGQRATHPCHGRGKSRRNQIKASLRAFQRREVKVLGFGVKTRPRPQRMASRRYSVPFALVGAISKACGEARVCVFSGSPPCVVVACSVCCRGSFLFCPCVGGVRVSAAFACRPCSSVGGVRALASFTCHRRSRIDGVHVSTRFAHWLGSCVNEVHALAGFMCRRRSCVGWVDVSAVFMRRPR